jgi:hypothetical protein
MGRLFVYRLPGESPCDASHTAVATGQWEAGILPLAVPLYFLLPNFPPAPKTHHLITALINTSSSFLHPSLSASPPVEPHRHPHQLRASSPSRLARSIDSRPGERLRNSRVLFHNPFPGLHLSSVSKSLPDRAAMSYGGGYNGRGNGYSNGYVVISSCA